MKASTLDDVAALARVSSKTVSRVVNGEPNVSPETRERVQQAIAELDYSLNLSARALAAQRSFLIGALSRNIASYYVEQVLGGGVEACRRRGYRLTVQTIDIDDPARVAEFGRLLRATRMDGAILTPPLTDDARLLDLLDAEGVRYARLAPMGASDRSDAVFADDRGGVEAAVARLWSDGHRRFGVVQGLGRHLSTRVRRDAVVDTVAALGGDRAAVRVTVGRRDVYADLVRTGAGNPATRAGYEAAAELLAGAGPRPTAVFAFNDEVAAGVVGWAHDHGLRVPDDLSVVGFDDSLTASVVWPPLTTVRQPIAEMAAQAVEWLTAPPGDTPRAVTLPVELVVRASTGPAPAG